MSECSYVETNPAIREYEEKLDFLRESMRLYETAISKLGGVIEKLSPEEQASFWEFEKSAFWTMKNLFDPGEFYSCYLLRVLSAHEESFTGKLMMQLLQQNDDLLDFLVLNLMLKEDFIPDRIQDNRELMDVLAGKIIERSRKAAEAREQGDIYAKRNDSYGMQDEVESCDIILRFLEIYGCELRNRTIKRIVDHLMCLESFESWFVMSFLKSNVFSNKLKNRLLSVIEKDPWKISDFLYLGNDPLKSFRDDREGMKRIKRLVVAHTARILENTLACRYENDAGVVYNGPWWGGQDEDDADGSEKDSIIDLCCEFCLRLSKSLPEIYSSLKPLFKDFFHKVRFNRQFYDSHIGKIRNALLFESQEVMEFFGEKFGEPGGIDFYYDLVDTFHCDYLDQRVLMTGMTETFFRKYAGKGESTGRFMRSALYLGTRKRKRRGLFSGINSPAVVKQMLYGLEEYLKNYPTVKNLRLTERFLLSIEFELQDYISPESSAFPEWERLIEVIGTKENELASFPHSSPGDGLYSGDTVL